MSWSPAVGVMNRFFPPNCVYFGFQCCISGKKSIFLLLLLVCNEKEKHCIPFVLPHVPALATESWAVRQGRGRAQEQLSLQNWGSGANFSGGAGFFLNVPADTSWKGWSCWVSFALLESIKHEWSLTLNAFQVPLCVLYKQNLFRKLENKMLLKIIIAFKNS